MTKWVFWKPEREWTIEEIEDTIFAAGPMKMYLAPNEDVLDFHFYYIDTKSSGASLYITRDDTYSFRYAYSDLAVTGSLNNGVTLQGMLQSGQYDGTVSLTYLDGSVAEEEMQSLGFTADMLHGLILQQSPIAFSSLPLNNALQRDKPILCALGQCNIGNTSKTTYPTGVYLQAG